MSFESENFIWLDEQRYATLLKEQRVVDPYPWGHCGPLYYQGKVLIHDRTLGT